MEPLKTKLYEIHKKLNANIINFHGVLLPVFYTSIQEEHNATRNSAGIFDVSHMGNIIIDFPDIDVAIEKLNYLLPNDFTKTRKNKIIYSTMLKQDGTVIDDILVMQISDSLFHIIANFTNIEKDYKWINENIGSKDIKIINKSDSFAIISLQGPKAFDILKNEFNFPIENLKTFELIEFPYKEGTLIISRTGYTGEDGFEIFIDNSFVSELFLRILEKGEKYGIKPCGLGARDTLRLEAGLPLYGQELDEEHSPLQSMMAWSVKLNKSVDFIGKKAIIENKNGKFSDTMIGFCVEAKAIPRTGMDIVNMFDEKVGVVTSGTYAPTLKKNIGIAYIKQDYKDNNDLFVKIRNKKEKIEQLALPFYKREKGV